MLQGYSKISTTFEHIPNFLAMDSKSAGNETANPLTFPPIFILLSHHFLIIHVSKMSQKAI